MITVIYGTFFLLESKYLFMFWSNTQRLKNIKQLRGHLFVHLECIVNISICQFYQAEPWVTNLAYVELGTFHCQFQGYKDVNSQSAANSKGPDQTT